MALGLRRHLSTTILFTPVKVLRGKECYGSFSWVSRDLDEFYFRQRMFDDNCLFRFVTSIRAIINFELYLNFEQM